MNKIYSFLLLTLGLLSTFSCQSDELNDVRPAAKGVDIEIHVEDDFEMNSRSMITSCNSIHHIEHLYAYVFEGLDEKAKCVYEEKLPWVPSETPKNKFRCTLGATTLIDKQNYMILVVGTDNNNDTYDFPVEPTSAATDQHLCMIGKTLAEAKLTLAKGIPATLMAYTEIFAGIQNFTTAEPLITVTMSRRVAGALCYVKDIPAKVNEYNIVGMQLHLVGGQNTALSLCPQRQGDAWVFPQPTDAKRTESVKLAEFDLKGRGAEPSQDSITLYVPPTHVEGVLQTLPNTALMSAYLLPVKADAHFAIVLVGEKRNDKGAVIETHVFTEGETGGYFPVKSAKGEDSYGLSADHFYSMGQKLKGYTTEGDHPLSLLGVPIIVESKPWEVETVDVNFPRLRDYAVLENGKQYDNHKYIYNCMHPSLLNTSNGTGEATETFALLNVPDNSVGWKLIVRGKDGNKCDWIYVRKTGEQTWTQSIEVREALPQNTVIELWMADFIEDRNLPYDPSTDIREAEIILTTLSNNKSQTILIRQYNALIVEVRDGKKDKDSYGHRAFSRLDMGQIFKDDGTPGTDIPTFEWGMNKLLASTIFGWESKNTGQYGHYNYKYALEGLHADELKGSAIALGHQLVKAGTPGTTLEDKYWFLPARAELNSFMRTYNKDPYCITSEFRWSGTATGGDNWKQAYAASIDHHHYKDDILCRNRDNHYPIRQACGFGK